VKKATRDLNQLLNNIESPMTRLETVHKKYTELLADMKKLDRDYAKSKKRADQLQKDQDKGKSELNKTATMKDKLEKLFADWKVEQPAVPPFPQVTAKALPGVYLAEKQDATARALVKGTDGLVASTSRLVRATWGLVCATAALVVAEVILKVIGHS